MDVQLQNDIPSTYPLGRIIETVLAVFEKLTKHGKTKINAGNMFFSFSHIVINANYKKAFNPLPHNDAF